MQMIVTLLGVANITAAVAAAYFLTAALRLELSIRLRLALGASVVCMPFAALFFLHFIVSFLVEAPIQCSGMFSCLTAMTLENLVESRWLNLGMTALAVAVSVGSYRLTKAMKAKHTIARTI